jgi:hypothetical protein
MAAMESAVNTIVKLWVNGAAVVADDAVLEVNPTTRAWRVRATLARHSPFKQQFGLSMQLADGRTAAPAWQTRKVRLSSSKVRRLWMGSSDA